MKISPVQAFNIENTTFDKSVNSKRDKNFSEVFKSTLEKVNDLQLNADQKIVEFTTGNSSVDIHDVMVNMEKANLALQLTIEIRNKIVESYQEIMRMQV